MTDMSMYSARNKRYKGVPVFMMLWMGVDTEGILSIKTGYTATVEIVQTLNVGTDSQTLHSCFMISSIIPPVNAWYSICKGKGEKINVYLMKLQPKFKENNCLFVKSTLKSAPLCSVTNLSNPCRIHTSSVKQTRSERSFGLNPDLRDPAACLGQVYADT